MIQAGVELARVQACDLVIGWGGGSAIDAGKAIAILANNPGEALDYLEVIGRGQALQAPSLPFMAIPTTAGTGAEVTRNAVIAVPERRMKVSLRSPLMLPRLALVDPEQTYSLPPGLTASTGLDALTQLIEPFVCKIPNPLVDAICREGLRYSARSLREGLSGWQRCGSTPRPVSGQPVRRAGPGKRQAGCGARLRRRAGWDVPRAAWRRVRPAVTPRLQDEYPGHAAAPAGASGVGAL